MQITNTIEIVCAVCGESLPIPLFSKDPVRGVFVIEAMPCQKCNKENTIQTSNCTGHTDHSIANPI